MEIMQGIESYTYKSAIARISRLPGGVAQVQFFGVLNKHTLPALRSRCAESTQGAIGLVVRLDTAVLSGCFDLCTNERIRTSPVAFVASPEQRHDVLNYSALCAASGVIRAVFDPAQLALAERWAARNSLELA